MKHTLEDGRTVDIVPISAKIPTKWFLDFINRLVVEDTFLFHTKKMNLKEEEKWKKNMIKSVKSGKQVSFVSIYGNRVIGSCRAARDSGRIR